MRTKDFVTAFRPEDGDLVYGRAEARAAYFSNFTPAQVAACNDLGAWVTIDEYNNHFGTSGAAFAAGAFVADIRKHVVGRDVINTTDAAMQVDIDVGFRQLAQREAYRDKIVLSRHSPMSVLHPVRGTPKLAQEGFTAGIPAGRTAADAHENNMAYKSIRRACKFGIGLVAIEASFRDPRAKIRFVLDGLDMEAVAGKQARQGYDRFAVPITSSELRYVYRNWADLRNFVKFYVNLAAVKAPWEEDWDLPSIVAPGIPPRTCARKAEWDAYGAARGQKYPGGLPAKSLI